jgi:transposase
LRESHSPGHLLKHTSTSWPEFPTSAKAQAARWYSYGHEVSATPLGWDRHAGEVSYKKGQKYITSIYDLDRAKVLWVGEGKARETIDHFVTEVLTTVRARGTLIS